MSIRNRRASTLDRKSTRLNSSHTEIYTLSLHDALPIYRRAADLDLTADPPVLLVRAEPVDLDEHPEPACVDARSEEHTSELQSHRDLHSFPTRRSSDLPSRRRSRPDGRPTRPPRAGRARRSR